MSVSEILGFALDEETQIPGRQHEVRLKSNPMDGVKGDQSGWTTIAEITSVSRYLPLVVADYTQLQQLRHCLVERQQLTNTPLHGEGLTRSFIGPGFLAVDFPVSSKVCRGPLILGDIEGSTAGQVVAPITR